VEQGGFLQQFLQQLINGVSQGSIYALIALGYTMVYGILRLINFSHGEIYMVGAYVGYLASIHVASLVPNVLALPLIVTLVCAMTGAAILGMLIERIAYRRLRNAPKISALISAIGVSFFLMNGMMVIATPQPRTFPNIFPQQIYDLGGLTVTNQQILILVLSFFLMAILTYIVQSTKIGKAMRAVSFDVDAARLMGIPVDRVIAFTFALGSALAAAAGVLVGIYYNSIDPQMGVMPGLKAFVAAVLGGIGVIPGAMAGGLLLGIIESMVSGFWSSTFRDAVAFGILIMVLLFRPAGLFGKNTKEKV
jgi:branched-chain amino acid transport system permease protein